MAELVALLGLDAGVWWVAWNLQRDRDGSYQDRLSAVLAANITVILVNVVIIALGLLVRHRG